MRTYDPADCILYVHLGAGAAVSPTPAATPEECHALPADYANATLRDRIGPARTAGRPALVLLSGGLAPDEGLAGAAPALTLAQ
jgi:hypothetical protein